MSFEPSGLTMTNLQLSILFFLQLAAILGACRGGGWLARKVGQPQVVGEMIAGVVLGPSLFGLLAPSLQQQLFPKSSMAILFCVSQVGLSLYMFIVGTEFRTELFLGRIRSAASVSLAGMLVPFVLGVGLAFWLFRHGGLFGEKVARWEAALFLGAAMCITAFPMLARIIYERGLAGTSLGTLALAAGAIDDGAAWCILALVLASFGDSWMVAVKAIGGGALYAVVTLTLGRRWLSVMGDLTERNRGVTMPMLSFTLALVMLASWWTDYIGIYAVFGAFILGAAMPRGRFVEEMQKKLEPLVVVFLLPLFFTYSGLNTRLDMVDSAFLWWVALLVLLAACLGKGVACWAAARWHGEDNRTALAVGTLMNARGLMELIILNIGLQHGIIQPTLFSIMVIMAIVTTLMATPIFEWVYGRHARAAGQVGAVLSA
ncbi:MAG: cation:proton antiporter [Verrucomicrobiales bacterium]|nr:cation:proton antiporter [Verrucomicrobiales bacterium]